MRGMREEGGRGTGIHEVLVLYVYVYVILRWKKTEGDGPGRSAHVEERETQKCVRKR